MKRNIVMFMIVGFVLATGVFWLICKQYDGNVEQQNKSTPSQKNSNSNTNMENSNIIQTNNIVHKELSIPRDEFSIYGMLTAPEGYENKKLPLIILGHGFNNTLSNFNNYADNLARKGYLVYTFDFVGGSRNSKSGGSMLEMSVFTEQNDFTAVLNKLKEESYVAEDAIFLAGYSQGGVVATLTALENENIVRGLIPINSAYVLFDDAKNIFNSVADIPLVYNHRGSELGKIYFEKLLDFDIYQKMPSFKKGVLLIHGSADEVVPLRYATKANQTFPNSKLKVIERGTHRLNVSQAEIAVDYIDEFIKEQLK